MATPLFEGHRTSISDASRRSVGRMPGLEIVPVPSEPGPGWTGETGLVTDAVDPRNVYFDAFVPTG